MAQKYNTNYDPKYPWRQTMNWDHCPGCFENFDLTFKCDHCGSGHADYDSNRKEEDHENG